MSFTVVKIALSGDVARDAGMRGKSTTSTTETVLHTTNVSSLSLRTVGITLTAKSGISGTTIYVRVRRDSSSGEILLEGSTTSSTETLIAAGEFPKGSGVFVWTAWSSSSSVAAYLGENRCGLVGGDFVFRPRTQSLSIPVKLGVTKLKVASLINYVAVNGFSALAPATFEMPAEGILMSGLQIFYQTLQAGEELLAVSVEGSVLGIG